MIIADVIAQLAIQIVNLPGIWYGDFRVLTTFIVLLSLGFIFAIQWLEFDRLRNANGVVLFYWLLLLLAYSVKLRSLVAQQTYDKNLTYFVAFTVGFGLSLAEFLLEWLWPRQTSAYEAVVDDGEECPEEYATVFSRLTFSWITPMMKTGYKHYLTEDDLWGLAPTDKASSTGTQFDQAWQYELKHKKQPNLWTVMARAYGGPYVLAALFKIVSDLANFTQPQLLRYLISFVQSYDGKHEPQPPIKGYAISIGMFLVACLQTTMIVSLAGAFGSQVASKLY